MWNQSYLKDMVKTFKLKKRWTDKLSTRPSPSPAGEDHLNYFFFSSMCSSTHRITPDKMLNTLNKMLCSSHLSKSYLVCTLIIPFLHQPNCYTIRIIHCFQVSLNLPLTVIAQDNISAIIYQNSTFWWLVMGWKRYQLLIYSSRWEPWHLFATQITVYGWYQILS